MFFFVYYDVSVVFKWLLIFILFFYLFFDQLDEAVFLIYIIGVFIAVDNRYQRGL